MSGGSDFDVMCLQLHNLLNELKALTTDGLTIARIEAMQRLVVQFKEG